MGYMLPQAEYVFTQERRKMCSVCHEWFEARNMERQHRCARCQAAYRREYRRKFMVTWREGRKGTYPPAPSLKGGEVEWLVVFDPDETPLVGLRLDDVDVRSMLEFGSFTPGTVLKRDGGRLYRVVQDGGDQRLVEEAL